MLQLCDTILHLADFSCSKTRAITDNVSFIRFAPAAERTTGNGVLSTKLTGRYAAFIASNDGFLLIIR